MIFPRRCRLGPPRAGLPPGCRPWAAPLLLLPMMLLGPAACSPTVQLAAPKEPVHIKLDVKIEHEIRIKVERELDQLLRPESGLF
ncbi:MAG: YnbE family lipoprotein [Desulfurivibrio sp.]|nr:YnbE family lipoprotein [Desulfurivibrio sp.]